MWKQEADVSPRSAGESAERGPALFCSRFSRETKKGHRFRPGYFVASFCCNPGHFRRLPSIHPSTIIFRVEWLEAWSMLKHGSSDLCNAHHYRSRGPCSYPPSIEILIGYFMKVPLHVSVICTVDHPCGCETSITPGR